MVYYSITGVPEKIADLAIVARDVASMKLNCDKPRLHFIREDAGGNLSARARVCGMTTWHPVSGSLAIFIAHNLNPAETAMTIFHEVSHCNDKVEGLVGKLLERNLSEYKATNYERYNCPLTGDYNQVFRQLCQDAVSLCIDQGFGWEKYVTLLREHGDTKTADELERKVKAAWDDVPFPSKAQRDSIAKAEVLARWKIKHAEYESRHGKGSDPDDDPFGSWWDRLPG
jgi:hypothetical protein